MNKKEFEKLSEVQKIIGYKFQDLELLNVALTHSSYSNENKNRKKDNERLEFLGDSVLSLAVSNYIFRKYPEFPEGILTKARASTVCEATLFKVAIKLGLNKYLYLGKGEEITGGRNRPSIVSDLVEAVIGAIYIDGGFEPAEKFIISNMEVFIHGFISGHGSFVDYKTQLQEVLQKSGEVEINYEVIEESGPDHDKHFKVQVVWNNIKLAEGEGHSKKEAEQNSAKNALLKKIE